MSDPERNDEIRARQRSRARVTALILVAFAILFFFVTIAKIRGLNP
jgi:succinate dehydrogenase hydrophobic anchor subunit